MPMHIAPGEKFACFAFTFNGVADNVPEELQLGPRLWAVRKLDFDVARHREEWMGSIKLEALRDANFALYTTMPSSKPKILDEESLQLVETLNYVLYGILLRSEEHTSELQSRLHLVCRLLLEKKKKKK